MSEPVHISEVLPGVMANITQRMDARTQELRAQDQANRKGRILAAVRDFQRGLKNPQTERAKHVERQETLFGPSVMEHCDASKTTR